MNTNKSTAQVEQRHMPSRTSGLPVVARASALSAVAAAVLLSGCASIETTQQRIQTLEAEVTRSTAATQQQFPPPGLIRFNEPRLTATPVPTRSAQIPAQFNNRVTYAGLAPQTLSEVLATLTSMTGLAFDVRDVLAAPAPTAAGASPMPTAMPTGSSANLGQERIHYRFEGRLTDMLDDLAQRLDASWRYDERTRRVVFFRYESRILSVKLPPGAREVAADISIGGGGEGGAGGGGSVSISSEMAIDPWSALMRGIELMLSQSGVRPGATAATAAAPAAAGAEGGTNAISGAAGRVVANRELAQVIMVARPEMAARIADFVDQTNRRFARNVLIDVRVVELQDTVSANVGASLSAVLARATSGSQFEVRMLGAELPGAGTSGLTISGTRGDLSIDAVIRAMQSAGKVSLRNQGQIVAINGQPAPFQQANQISYLRSSETTVSEGISQTALTPGTVTVGFTANFLPTIMVDNRIMLQYQIQSSTLLGLRSFVSGDSSIQLPEIFTQSLQQQAYLNDGDVLVLFGFEQERSQIDDTRGVLAVGRSGVQNRVVTAVVIQVRAARI